MSAQRDLFEEPKILTPDEGFAAHWRVHGPMLEANLRALLLHFSVEPPRPCKACGVTLYMVLSREGSRVPYTGDGLNHFKNCTDPARFSQKAKR